MRCDPDDEGKPVDTPSGFAWWAAAQWPGFVVGVLCGLALWELWP